MEYGLWYLKGMNSLLVSYTDLYWDSCIDYKKRTIGGLFFLGKSLVTFIHKRKTYVSLYIVEVEYIIATYFCNKLLWIKKKI